MLYEETVALYCRNYKGHVNCNVGNMWCFNVNFGSIPINH